MRKLISLLLLSFLLTACDQEDEGTLHVLAAASLQKPLSEMKQTFEASHHVNLQLQFAGSGTLAQQIEQGAAADVFIAADRKWSDQLLKRDLLQKSSIQTIASNRLVLIGEKNKMVPDVSLANLPEELQGQIAIGHPETVPAGTYAKAALEEAGQWNKLQEELVYTSDVRQALTYVATGNVTYGFVYETDARQSEEVTIMLEVPENLHEGIQYPAAVVSGTKHEKLANEWIDFLRSEEGQKILASHHFKID